MSIATMCRMCGQNKTAEGFSDAGECADCQERIRLRSGFYVREYDKTKEELNQAQRRLKQISDIAAGSDSFFLEVAR